ncbi:DUF2285 domain-containing protein [Mesorhizobium sp. VK22B]|uniref:DUF2285 domain-containing protein n=1 Tax=Mesorhizobium captivum TaxID=3072319 RepID=A0ABU4YZX0_9HYPH|nr:MULTISPECIES: DUF2285 domain-containing protein [unclassified Mesorhizobium]MDX8492523.1 DUF2285 domain-containing protein [Mesorhizobium sp. VK22B]MDX8505612.1 DUF2285 domain-containing protein [Mesorhizobium sp. VK22E]
MPVPDFLASTVSAPFSDLGKHRDSPQGRHVVDKGRVVTQLLLLPGSDPDGPVAAVIPLDSETQGRIEALNRFWRAWQGRPAPPDTRMTVQRRRRLRLMMQAADGRANGASYREIATVLYGFERIASDPWKTSPLRDTVIGLVESSVAMIGGGYLQLLRHRRRS